MDVKRKSASMSAKGPQNLGQRRDIKKKKEENQINWQGID